MSSLPKIGIGYETMSGVMAHYKIPVLLGLTKTSLQKIPIDSMFVLLDQEHWMLCIRGRHMLLIFDSLGLPDSVLGEILPTGVAFTHWNRHGYQSEKSAVCGYYVIALIICINQLGMRANADDYLSFLKYNVDIPQTMAEWFRLHKRYSKELVQNDRDIVEFLERYYPHLITINKNAPPASYHQNYLNDVYIGNSLFNQAGVHAPSLMGTHKMHMEALEKQKEAEKNITPKVNVSLPFDDNSIPPREQQFGNSLPHARLIPRRHHRHEPPVMAPIQQQQTVQEAPIRNAEIVTHQTPTHRIVAVENNVARQPPPPPTTRDAQVVSHRGRKVDFVVPVETTTIAPTQPAIMKSATIVSNTPPKKHLEIVPIHIPNDQTIVTTGGPSTSGETGMDLGSSSDEDEEFKELFEKWKPGPPTHQFHTPSGHLINVADWDKLSRTEQEKYMRDPNEQIKSGPIIEEMDEAATSPQLEWNYYEFQNANPITTIAQQPDLPLSGAQGHLLEDSVKLALHPEEAKDIPSKELQVINAQTDIMDLRERGQEEKAEPMEDELTEYYQEQDILHKDYLPPPPEDFYHITPPIRRFIDAVENKEQLAVTAPPLDTQTFAEIALQTHTPENEQNIQADATVKKALIPFVEALANQPRQQIPEIQDTVQRAVQIYSNAPTQQPEILQALKTINYNLERVQDTKDPLHVEMPTNTLPHLLLEPPRNTDNVFIEHPVEEPPPVIEEIDDDDAAAMETKTTGVSKRKLVPVIDVDEEPTSAKTSRIIAVPKGTVKSRAAAIMAGPAVTSSPTPVIQSSQPAITRPSVITANPQWEPINVPETFGPPSGSDEENTGKARHNPKKQFKTPKTRKLPRWYSDPNTFARKHIIPKTSGFVKPSAKVEEQEVVVKMPKKLMLPRHYSDKNVFARKHIIPRTSGLLKYKTPIIVNREHTVPEMAVGVYAPLPPSVGELGDAHEYVKKLETKELAHHKTKPYGRVKLPTAENTRAVVPRETVSITLTPEQRAERAKIKEAMKSVLAQQADDMRQGVSAKMRAAINKDARDARIDIKAIEEEIRQEQEAKQKFFEEIVSKNAISKEQQQQILKGGVPPPPPALPPEGMFIKPIDRTTSVIKKAPPKKQAINEPEQRPDYLAEIEAKFAKRREKEIVAEKALREKEHADREAVLAAEALLAKQKADRKAAHSAKKNSRIRAENEAAAAAERRRRYELDAALKAERAMRAKEQADHEAALAIKKRKNEAALRAERMRLAKERADLDKEEEALLMKADKKAAAEEDLFKKLMATSESDADLEAKLAMELLNKGSFYKGRHKPY